MLPQVFLAGNLVADPELRFTPSGIAVAKFRVACNDRRKNEAGEWVDGDTTFLDVTVWRQKAETVAERLSKGSKVMVQGRLAQRSYETAAGEKRTVYEVTADEVAEQILPKPAQRSTAAAGGDDPWATAWSQPAQGSEPPF